MAQDRFMEVPQVRQMADRLENVSRVLGMISDVLEAQMRILQATAFIGNVGGAAVQRYIQTIQPAIEELSNQCMEMSERARREATEWERQSQAG